MELVLGSEKQTRPGQACCFPRYKGTRQFTPHEGQNKSKGKHPSKEVLYLMGWSIFITTLSKDRMTPKQIAALYAVRWRIENIFNPWKSNFCFDHIHNVSNPQLRMLLLARLTI